MNISELEKERMSFSFLKMIHTSGKGCLRIFITKNRRNKFWNRYKTIYGESFVGKFVKQMADDGLLKADTTGKYIVSNKGIEVLKRGWVYYERRWYDADIIRKYSFILSIVALLLSIIGTENLRKWIIYIWQWICK